MSNQHFYRYPFASAGDKTDIPEATQTDGSVSYNQGFGFDYERDPSTDPSAKNIQRDDFNGVLFDITDNLRQYQLFGVPEWVTAAQNGGNPVPYARYARVRYQDVVYESAVQDNTSTPGADTNWTVVVNSTYYGNDAGTANAYSVAYVPPLTALRDGMVLGFTAANANTGASTFSPSGLAARPILGLAQSALQGGEILAGSRVTLQYSSALNSWVILTATGGAVQVASPSASGHAVNQGQANIAYATPVGTIRNGAMRVATASATATFLADEVVVETALGGQSYRLASFSQAVNLATTGAGGMDTGSAPVNGYVALYAIYNPATKAKNILAVNATAARAPEVYGGSNMPAGFTASALVSVWATNGSGQLKVGTQRDRKIDIPVATAVSTSAMSASFVQLSIAPIVPLNAVSVGGVQTMANSGGNASMNGTLASDTSSTGWKLLYVVSSGGGAPFDGVLLSTAQTVFYSATGGTNYSLYLSSYSF